MEQNKKINISKEIIMEKNKFIYNNSTFFNTTSYENLLLLKEILLNHSPLTQCDGYIELMDEIKKSKFKNNNFLNYQNSLEVLFSIVYSILHNVLTSEESKKEQIESIRQYVKRLNTNSSEIYYHNQNIVSVNEEQLCKVKNLIKEEKQKKSIM